MNVSELTEERSRLEQEAATILGYMLFEYTRLDMELGLFLVWFDGGQNSDELTKAVGKNNFNKRLEHLENTVRNEGEDPSTRDIYSKWLADAHVVRTLRNQLFHGRWGIIPHKHQVANVVGLPTSSEQYETRYSIKQLEEQLQSIRELRNRLNEIRDTRPI